ncbi:MAG: thermopsin [Thermoplasmata archaeon]|nr:thermopsin [Thermoplasmata archaeon]
MPIARHLPDRPALRPHVIVLVVMAAVLSLLFSNIPGWAGPPPSGIGAPRGHPESSAVNSVTPERSWVFPPRAHVVPLPPLAGGGVDPFAIRTTEPAPNGVTDFGVDSQLNPYRYATDEFVGTAKILRLSTYSAACGGGMSFQLNSEIVIHAPAGDYYYWIQNVISIDSATRAMSFIDNIWNFSSPTATLTSSMLSGNGTVSNGGGFSLYYYSNLPTTLPGAYLTLSYPSNVSVEVKTRMVGGHPTLWFLYDDGFGWQVYDSVTFHEPHAATGVSFLVDGYTYSPSGLYFDAEFDFAGCSATGETNLNSTLWMSLQYDNGHTLQAPPTTWNFGENTAEETSNVITTANLSSGGGVPGALETTGSGTLGSLYGHSNISVVNLSTRVPNGTLEVNSVDYPYRGLGTTLTLDPGRYTIDLFNSSRFVVERNITLSPGEVTSFEVTPLVYYPLALLATGLPTGTAWSVSVDGNLTTTTNGTISLRVLNGTHTYVAQPVPGSTTTGRLGTVLVAGHGVNVTIAYFPFTYLVTFTATGRPEGITWTVTVDGASYPTDSTSVSIGTTNGSHPFNVSAPFQYLLSPSNGTISVQARPLAQAIDFLVRPGYLGGDVSPAEASVLVDGQAVLVTAGAFNVTKLPGVHNLTVELAGYATFWANLTVTAGNLSFEPVTLHLASSEGGRHGSSVPSATTELEIGIGALAVTVAAGLLLVLRGRPRR